MPQVIETNGIKATVLAFDCTRDMPEAELAVLEAIMFKKGDEEHVLVTVLGGDGSLGRALDRLL